jgi:hypothetical protein
MRTSIVTFVLFLLAACSWPAKTSPPTVASTVPAKDAADVPLQQAISATLSEAIVASTVGAASFALTPAVAGAVTVSGSVATFTPGAPLIPGTLYKATFAAAAQGAVGGPLAAEYTWSFTTVPRPTVASTIPAGGASMISTAAPISATFSQPMVAAALQNGTFSLSPSVPGSVAVSGSTATFTPDAPLAYATTYTAVITTAATAQSGAALGSAFIWNFTTIPPAPVVASTSPAANDRTVGLHPAVAVAFSKPMDLATLQAPAFTITPGAWGAASIDGLTVTLTPTAPLSYDTVYTGTITTDAKDSGGLPLAANYTWSFATAADIAPAMVSTTPADGTDNVPLDSTFSVTFSKPMLASSINIDTITLDPPVEGATVSLTAPTVATFAFPGKKLVYQNVTDPPTFYDVNVTAGCLDVAGTPLAADTLWQFRTAIDPPPAVDTFSPAARATNVAYNAKVAIAFTQPMSVPSLTDGIIVQDDLGVIGGDITYDGRSMTATFTPNPPLRFSAFYTVDVSGAQNLNGTSNAEFAGFGFTVQAQPPGAAAFAGKTQDVRAGSTVTLAGGGKGTAPLSFAWTQVFGPTVTLSSNTEQKPTFTAPADVTTVQFDLVVTDSAFPAPTTSAPSRVQINVMQDPAAAHFVSGTGLDTNAGTRAAPFATVKKAISSAAAGHAVYIAAGSYDQAETLQLASGVSIFGGFNGASWIRTGAVTQIHSLVPMAIRGAGVTGSAFPMVVDGLMVTTADATLRGSSAYGFLFTTGANATGNVVGSNVTVSNNAIIPGRGAPGFSGTDAALIPTAAKGADGDKGCQDNTCGAAAGGFGGGLGTAIAGGNGGFGGAPGANGVAGFVGLGPAPGAAGHFGALGVGQNGAAGGDGGDATASAAPGTAGDPGTNGAGAYTPNGYNASGTDVNGKTGQPGGVGSGGGGGGGGGGWCDNPSGCGVSPRRGIGNGGGGGGQGGAAGAPGGGGRGGGGSFGIYSFGSTITRINTSVTSNGGGPGGRGGFGTFGAGGPGGLGGAAGTNIGFGGNGGHGSAGAKGGDGGKGGDGPFAEVSNH